MQGVSVDWTMDGIVHNMSTCVNDDVPVTVKYLAKRNPFLPLQLGSTLLEAAKVLSGTAHRVPIVDKDGRCVCIISQSNFLKFLYQFKDAIAGDSKTSVAEAGFLKEVVCVQTDELAVEAFKAMDQHGLSGIGVVDKEGKMVGNTSARDIKHSMVDLGQQLTI